MGWHVSFDEVNQINFKKEDASISVRRIYIRKGVRRCKEYTLREDIFTGSGLNRRQQHKFRTEAQLMDYLLEGKIHEGTKTEQW